jgi:hypothetical protein
MSCGPAESVGKLVDGINNTVSIVENTIAALPQGVASIPGYAELSVAVQIQQDLQNLKGMLDDPVAALENAIPSLSTEFQSFIESGNDLIGDIIDQAEFIGSLGDKYGDFDYGDPEELIGAIAELQGDLGRLCEVVPNVQTRYGEFVKKGKAVSQTIERPENPIKAVKNTVLDRYEDVYEAAEERTKQAKEDAKDPNSLLNKSLFGVNKQEIDTAKNEQKKFTS